MKIKELYFYVKVKNKEYLNGVLSRVIRFNKAIEIENIDFKDIEKKYLTQDYVDKLLIENQFYSMKDKCEVSLIYLTHKTKFIKGEYYAHEYDKYVDGKARRLEYSNGLVEYEIHCLDKDLIVLDGIWDEHDNNGCGDRFEPYEHGLTKEVV